MKIDTRSFARKPVRGRALIVLPNGAKWPAKPKDLSKDGISVVTSEPLAMDVKCTVALETVCGSEIVHLMAQAKVIYCILSGTEGFRAGLQFTQIDSANNAVLAQLLA
ncbi:MAG TPA: PilZ domain-containing protein [Noviherbaspirillum sp.]|nr:PilZ domain-containing protein [Noviherbaspirillum sp.]